MDSGRVYRILGLALINLGIGANDLKIGNLKIGTKVPS